MSIGYFVFRVYISLQRQDNVAFLWCFTDPFIEKFKEQNKLNATHLNSQSYRKLLYNVFKCFYDRIIKQAQFLPNIPFSFVLVN